MCIIDNYTVVSAKFLTCMFASIHRRPRVRETSHLGISTKRLCNGCLGLQSFAHLLVVPWIIAEISMTFVAMRFSVRFSGNHLHLISSRNFRIGLHQIWWELMITIWTNFYVRKEFFLDSVGIFFNFVIVLPKWILMCWSLFWVSFVDRYKLYIVTYIACQR